MNIRTLYFYASTAFLLLLYGCGGDTPPEKTVGSITFVITEENTPETLSGVSVQLFSDDDPSVTPADRTDNSGRCTFSNIPVGTYRLNLSKPGYESKEGLSQRINGGDNPNKEISLRRVTTELTVSPSVLDFGDNESVIQKSFGLTNPNYMDLSWAVVDADVPWIVSVCDMNGNRKGTLKYNQEIAISVTIDRKQLSGGDNESTIVILSDFGRAELKIKAKSVDKRATTNMLDVADVDLTTALFKGEILSDGEPEYTTRGFVYSTSAVSSDATSGFTKITAPKNADKVFSVSVTGLKQGTTYYVRAFAENAKGLKLSSNSISFTTIASRTTVSTLAVSSIDVVNRKVQLNGSITAVGNPVYSEKGFCLNTAGEPTIVDTKLTVSGSGSGAFSYVYANLETNTTYYVRAFAIQSGKVYYGTAEHFVLSDQKTQVTTSAATNVSLSSATLNGTVIKVGSPAYSERGFFYSKSDSPANGGTKVTVGGTGEGDFSKTVTGLTYETKYYFTAYAIQNGTTVLGSTVSFITSGVTSTEVITMEASSVTSSSAILNGSILSVGNPVYTEKGFCLSTDYNPTIESTKYMVSGTSAGDFSRAISGLAYDTRYYFRAYAIQNGDVKYGSIGYFDTDYTKASVITSDASDIGYHTLTFNGQVTNVGDPQITERGFCYSSTHDVPSVSDKIVKVSLSGTFRATVSNLEEDARYYFRAYVIQDGKPIYGNVKSETTYYEPLVVTGSATNVKISSDGYSWQAKLRGRFVDGNPEITDAGFVFSNYNNPTVNNGTKLSKGFDSINESSSGVWEFTRTYTKFNPNKTYYFRAYIYNSLSGYIYGETYSFSTY